MAELRVVVEALVLRLRVAVVAVVVCHRLVGDEVAGVDPKLQLRSRVSAMPSTHRREWS